MELSGFGVGDRIRDSNGYRATVKYVGPVEGTKGEWLGVEWDAGDVRGKHDGSHNGRVYFRTRSEKSGSFVRPAKVSGKGVDLTDAVEDKYGLVKGATAGTGGVQQNVLDDVSKEIGAAFVQVVGFDMVNQKQSDFKKLQAVSLEGSLLSKLGTGQPLGLVQILDISDTLVDNWTIVCDMCRPLKHLKKLTVSKNRLNYMPDTVKLLPKSLPVLEEIVMAEMSYDWSQVLELTGNLPKLQFLQCPVNSITGTHLSSRETFRNLKLLNLSTNPIEDWGSVMTFSRLENLEVLILNEFPVKTIRMGKEPDTFPALKILHMVDCLLEDWESVSNLGAIKNLSVLKIRGCPVFRDLKPLDIRYEVVARLGRLEVLNGTAVERQERRSAEIDYWKGHGLEFLDAKKDSARMARFNRENPRYRELVQKLGEPAIEEVQPSKANSLMAGLLELNIKFPDREDVRKKIPGTMTVGKVKIMLQRMTKMKASDLILFFEAKDHPQMGEMEMESDLRELNFYDLKSEDSIIVKFK